MRTEACVERFMDTARSNDLWTQLGRMIYGHR